MQILQSEGNRLFDGNESIDPYGNGTGDIQAMVKDIDGSLTGQAGVTVVKPLPLTTTDSCVYRSVTVAWSKEKKFK